VFIAIPILVLWYSFHAVLSRFAGTCTMGDTDRFVAGMILGMPAAAIAVGLLVITPSRTRWQIGIVLATALLATVVLCFWTPLAISAGLRGHHLCGPEFDDYLGATRGWERLIPLAHVALASALLMSGVWSVRTSRRAAQLGAEPDGRSRGRRLTPQRWRTREVTTAEEYTPKNAPGPFVVLKDQCITCGVPESEAPELMAHDDEANSCYFRRQPTTPEETGSAIRAVQVSCCEAVVYRGSDPEILRRIKEPYSPRGV
jgi:hypothetical protein